MKRKNRSFTLIEVLIFSLISGIILYVLSSIFTGQIAMKQEIDRATEAVLDKEIFIVELEKIFEKIEPTSLRYGKQGALQWKCMQKGGGAVYQKIFLEEGQIVMQSSYSQTFDQIQSESVLFEGVKKIKFIITHYRADRSAAIIHMKMQTAVWQIDLPFFLPNISNRGVITHVKPI